MHHAHTNSRLGQFILASPPKTCFWRTGEPGGNLNGHGENVQTQYGQKLSEGSNQGPGDYELADSCGNISHIRPTCTTLSEIQVLNGTFL